MSTEHLLYVSYTPHAVLRAALTAAAAAAAALPGSAGTKPALFTNHPQSKQSLTPHSAAAKNDWAL